MYCTHNINWMKATYNKSLLSESVGHDENILYIHSVIIATLDVYVLGKTIYSDELSSLTNIPLFAPNSFKTLYSVLYTFQ